MVLLTSLAPKLKDFDKILFWDVQPSESNFSANNFMLQKKILLLKLGAYFNLYSIQIVLSLKIPVYAHCTYI